MMSRKKGREREREIVAVFVVDLTMLRHYQRQTNNWRKSN